MNKFYKYGFYTLSIIPILWVSVTIYYGVPASLNALAQTRIDIPLDVANCIGEFNGLIEVE